MKTHEFFQKYANTPLHKRFEMINFNKLGGMTLSDVYLEIKRLEDEMRPKHIEQDKLLRVANEYFNLK